MANVQRLILLSLLGVAASSSASELTPHGELKFSKDALATYGFETPLELLAVGAQSINWVLEGTEQVAHPEALSADQLAPLLVTDAALEGAQALLIKQGTSIGVALRDTSLFSSLSAQQFSVTMWGRALGAEPELRVVYALPSATSLAPGFPNVIAMRTGRETSDGWAEYSTGPIDGTAWTAPVAAIILTAVYPDNRGRHSLLDWTTAPDKATTYDDASASALIDAVEVRALGSALVPAPSAACTQATITEACGVAGECEFGHCLNAALVWGPTPTQLSDRRDLVERWAFVTQHLMGDRRATASAATALSSDVVTALANETSPRTFFGELNRILVGLRDSHTTLGAPPSNSSLSYPLVTQESGTLDVCIGLVKNDLDDGAVGFALYAVGKASSIKEKLVRGDLLIAIDDMPPLDWFASYGTRLSRNLPNDPAADPADIATVLPHLIGKYASTIQFSRCSATGCAAQAPIHVADEVFTLVSSMGNYHGNVLTCSGRFTPSSTKSTRDAEGNDLPVVATVDGVTSIQFDGYETTDHAAWETPIMAAFADCPKNVIVDARVGHGGQFTVLAWMFELLRGTEEPFGILQLPRGDYDDPDPAWLLSASWFGCSGAELACRWTQRDSAFTNTAKPAGASCKIAWLDGDDVSANDIEPRLLQGRKDLRIFGPHATHGAYGIISTVPAIGGAWGNGSLQVQDSRFGIDPADAIAATWESGKGVVPDEIVVQTMSDLLANRDTTLAAANAWLASTSGGQ